MSTRKISRREFLYTGVAATAGAALVACGQPQTIVVETEKEVTVVVETEKEVVHHSQCLEVGFLKERGPADR